MTMTGKNRWLLKKKKTGEENFIFCKKNSMEMNTK